MKIFDNFLNSYEQLKASANISEFTDIENPFDKVTYPNISLDIPAECKEEIIAKITAFLGTGPTNITMFMRRSPHGVSVPHIAHHDLSMGSYSLMLYMNDYDAGGTAMLRHRDTGMCYAPESNDFVEIARFDQNNVEKWAIYDMAYMKENRAVIFDAGLFHCAMPIGGFGRGIDSRTVLTVFFS
jgi:hypothetical protein